MNQSYATDEKRKFDSMLSPTIRNTNMWSLPHAPETLPGTFCFGQMKPPFKKHLKARLSVLLLSLCVVFCGGLKSAHCCYSPDMPSEVVTADFISGEEAIT